jgi:hypothetical protein
MSLRSNSPTRSFYDNSDPLQPALVEELLKGQVEWRNIQDIIRVSFRALTDTVKSQGQLLRDIEKALSSKVTKSEFHAALSQKLDFSDFSENYAHLKAQVESKSSHFEVESLISSRINELNYVIAEKAGLEHLVSISETKVSTKEFSSAVDDMYVKLDMVHEEINRMLQVLPSQQDLNVVRDESNLKLNDLSSSLRSLEERHEISISKKLNRSEFDVSISRKNDEIKALHLAVEVKAEAEWTESSLKDLKTLINHNDESLSSLSQSLNELRQATKESFLLHQDQIKSVRNSVEDSKESLLKEISSKADNKELDKAVNLLYKKADTDSVHEQFSIQRKMTNESITEKVSDVRSLLKKTEENFWEKIKATEDYSKQLENSIKEARHVLKLLDNEQKDAHKETNENFKRDIEDTKEEFKMTLNKIFELIEQLNKDKASHEDYKDSMAKLSQKVSGKADLSEFDKSLQKSQKELLSTFQTIRDDYKIYFTKLENQMSAKFDQLVTRNELRAALNEKADNSQVGRLISTKLNIEEIVKLRSEIETALSEMKAKASRTELESHVASTKIAIEEISKELLSKAYIKDICSLLDMKASIDDVNSALMDIHKELDNKITVQAHNVYVNEQQALNTVLCSENTIGRWIWRSGELAGGFAVPWEIQCVNTAPDNYIWEPESSSILVVAPGLYEITFGFYSKKKPTVQLLVNGETILSAVNNASYVIHHSSGRLKGANSPASTIAGLTMIDFIALPPRAKLSLSYNGERKCEGFLALRKL